MNALFRQQGMISTLMAVIVLVVSLLAAMALMRSVDTSTNIATTLTFRQSALQEAERAYVDAQQKIIFTQPDSDGDHKERGYYAQPQPATARSAGDIPDVLIKQTLGSIGTVPDNNDGNTVTYVVERLCPSTGTASASTCIVPGATITSGNVSNQSSDNKTFNNLPNAAFRLTVRVDGPKETTAYVQTILR
jgi:Tfp pilus assembly protein PilX